MKILNEQTEFEMEHPEINKDALLLSESVNLSLQLLKLPYFLGRCSLCRPHTCCVSDYSTMTQTLQKADKTSSIC